MAQISKEKMDQLWGDKRSNRIWVLCNALNEEDTIGKMIESIKPLNPYKILIALDDRTVDKTREVAESLGAEVFSYKWIHNFADVKNELTRRVPPGDWCLVIGADMAMQPQTIKPLLKFVQDPLNVAAKFWIPEYHPLRNHKNPLVRLVSWWIPVVTRPRALLWRSHPFLYWQHIVHEEMVWSLYRLLEIGLAFRPDQMLPFLGGKSAILHYDTHISTSAHRWWKRCYYLILWEVNKVMHRLYVNDTEDGMKVALSLITGNEVTDVKNAIDYLLEKYMRGEIPEGLGNCYDNERDYTNKNLEYD